MYNEIERDRNQEDKSVELPYKSLHNIPVD